MTLPGSRLSRARVGNSVYFSDRNAATRVGICLQAFRHPPKGESDLHGAEKPAGRCRHIDQSQGVEVSPDG